MMIGKGGGGGSCMPPTQELKSASDSGRDEKLVMRLMIEVQWLGFKFSLQGVQNLLG
jgi:hypothetical protein